MLNKSLFQALYLSVFTLSFSTFTQANLISKSELDLVIKEDIAAAQALNSICPALVSNTEAIKKQVDQFTTENLVHLATSLTFEQLQADAEYQTAYQEALAEQSQYSKEEQKQGCEELINNTAE